MSQNEFNIRKLTEYKINQVLKFEKGIFKPTCIFCERTNELTTKAFWRNDKEKTAFAYHICTKCSKFFFGLTETERDKIIANYIEKKILITSALFRFKKRDAIAAGFEIEY